MTFLKCLFLLVLLPGALCDGWSIHMPEHLEVLAGSCLLLPCTFSIPHSEAWKLRRPAGGVWRKIIPWFKGSIDVFNSSRKQNIINGEILGDLLKKNCTSILDNFPLGYNDNYYFRIETGFLFTFRPAVRIKVRDTPIKPSLSGAETVYEGTDVNLTCEAVAPCPRLPPIMKWTPKLGTSVENVWVNKDGTKQVNSVLSFRATRDHNRQQVRCVASYRRQRDNSIQTAEQSLSLNVLYAPINTKVMERTTSGPVMEGDSVTLGCSSDANPPVTKYTWFRETGGHEMLYGTGQEITFNMTLDDVGNYSCQARNKHGAQNSSAIPLKVKHEEAPKNTKIIERIPTVPVMEGDSVTLVCSSDASPPVKYIWMRQTAHYVTRCGVGQNITFNMTFDHVGYYTCEAINKHGAQNSSTRELKVEEEHFIGETPPKPSLSGPQGVSEGIDVNLTCVASAPRGRLAPFITWDPKLGTSVEDVQVNSDFTKQVTSVLTFTATHDPNKQQVTCVASYKRHKDDSIQTAEQTLSLDVQYAPKNTKITEGIPAGPVMEGDSVTLVCSSDANPPATYTWFRETGGHMTHCGTGQNITFNMTFDTVGKYYCKAQNEHGAQNSSAVPLTVKKKHFLGGHSWILAVVSLAVTKLLLLGGILAYCKHVHIQRQIVMH